MGDLIVKNLDIILREFKIFRPMRSIRSRDSSSDIQLHSRCSEKQVLAYR